MARRTSSATKAEIEQTVAFLKRVKKMPPARRLQELTQFKSYDQRARDVIAKAEAIIARANKRGCSRPVIKAVTERGEKPIVKGMARSRGRVRIGDAEGTIPSRRLTPKPAVRMEDRYDCMTTEQADWCRDPSSVTGVQMALIRMRKGTEKEASGILSAARKNSRKAR